MKKQLTRRAFLRGMAGGGVGALVGMHGLTRLNGATQESPIMVGLLKQLLVDDAVISENVNLTPRPGSVTKAGPVLKPTLESDDGASFGFYHTALYNPNERKFQMWYSVGVRIEAENPYRGVGYAESDDGIHWTKPLVSTDGKSNIVLPMSGNSVLLDPTLPWGHEEKFKAAWMHPQSRVALSYSSDGRRWNHYNEGNPVSHRAGDTQNQIFWDPDRKAYLLGTRTDLGPGGGPNEHRGWRFMVHDKGGDIRNHPTAWKTILDRIAVNDPRQPKGSGVPDLQFHHICMWRQEDIWLQLFNIWTAPKQQEYDENDDQNQHDRDVSDYYLGASRDVVAIDRSFVHNRQPLIPRGAGGAWDDDIVVPSNNIVTRGDEHWIYYCGINERIFNFKNRGQSYVGIAKLPLDRFIGLRAGPTSGTLMTKPFQLAGPRLEMNVAAREGEVRVEVLDAKGQPLTGYCGDDATTHSNVDELRLSPRWKKPLSQIVGENIRLRFRLREAGLYSFQFLA
jgi:hypothetical protein